jgi:FG-GAP-like repeat
MKTGTCVCCYSSYATALMLRCRTRAISESIFSPPMVVGVFAADLNGDGKTDLVGADGSVALGNGDGTFQTGTPLTGLQGQFSVVGVGDFTGNGKIDLLVMNSTNLDVFFGNGDGTFQTLVVTNT